MAFGFSILFYQFSDVGASADLELVGGFCCLGDMVSMDGGASSAGVWVGWSEFRQSVPLCAGMDMSLVVGGGLCCGCVRDGVLCGLDLACGEGSWDGTSVGVDESGRMDGIGVGWSC